MKKVLIREALIFSALLILLALSMHHDLLDNPLHRFVLLQERGNYLHPFVYTLLVFLILFLLRFVVKKITTFVSKIRNK